MYQTFIRFLLLLIFLVGCFGCDGGLEEASPAAPAMSSPPDGATNLPNALALAWHASSGAETYHVQVSGTSAFTTSDIEAPNLTATSLTINGLRLGTTYYWRVRARNPAGFSAWSSPWTFTPSALAARPASPALQTPHDGAEHLPTSIVFVWHAAPHAATYHLQISQEPTFLRRDVDVQDIPLASKTINELVHGYTYYWRVRAHNPAGFSPWSRARRFVIETN